VEENVIDRPAPNETTPAVAASGDRGVGVGGDVIGSTIITGMVTSSKSNLEVPIWHLKKIGFSWQRLT